MKINRKTILIYPAILFGLISICLLLSAAKSVFEAPSSISSGELDFLKINLTQINYEAELAFEKKNYREASKKYIEILHSKPNDIPTLYNLARCYAFLKKPELAANALTHALDAGLNDISTLLSDSTWNPIKDNEKFKSTLELADRLKQERGESFFGECKILIKGRLREPENYDSTKYYPLLILLHGNGGNAEMLMSVRDRMEATNILVAAPQGPYPRKLLASDSPSYSWFLHTNDKKIWKIADPHVIEYILDIIRNIKSRYKISGVYLLGYSQGGALAYMTGINKPDIINGVICYGAQNPKEFIGVTEINNASSKLPIFISHGRIDPSVSFNEAQEAKGMFLKYGYKVTFKPFDGGHWLDAQTLIEAKEWIEENERQRALKQ